MLGTMLAAHLFYSTVLFLISPPAFAGVMLLAQAAHATLIPQLICCVQLLVLQVNNKLRAAEGEMRKMQGVISTEAEAEKCLSGLRERMHRRVTGLVQAAPEVADHRDKQLHIAPRVYAMLENYKSEVTNFSSMLRIHIKLHLCTHVCSHALCAQAHLLSAS